MVHRPTISKRTDTPFTQTTLCRTAGLVVELPALRDGPAALRQPGARRPCVDVPAGDLFRRRGLAETEPILGGRAERQGEKPCHRDPRSEDHTSELQSLMRISYAVFCLKKTKTTTHKQPILKD